MTHRHRIMMKGLLLISMWLGQADNTRLASSLNDEGLKLLDQGRLLQATYKFRKAVEADPQNAAALNNLGAALRKQRDYEGAVRVLEQAAKLRPNDAPIYVNLGLAVHGLHRPAEAVQALRKASSLEPGSAAVHRDLGILLTEADVRRGRSKNSSRPTSLILAMPSLTKRWVQFGLRLAW